MKIEEGLSVAQRYQRHPSSAPAGQSIPPVKMLVITVSVFSALRLSLRAAVARHADMGPSVREKTVGTDTALKQENRVLLHRGLICRLL